MIPTFSPVIVIGGGIIGLSAAYHLARRGVGVALIEKADGPVQASVRNAGGIRAQCRSRPERQLAMASIELWRQLVVDTGQDFEYRQTGNLRMAIEPSTLVSLAGEGADEAADGLVTEVWDAADLRRRAPMLSRRFAGAKYCATDGQANPILATWTMLDAARRAGASILNRTEAVRIEVDAGRAVAIHVRSGGSEARIATETVVHAAGPWTAGLASEIGVTLPLTPARDAMFVTRRTEPMFAPFVSSHELGVYTRQTASGHVHVGAVSSVRGTYDQTVGRFEMERLARVTELIPELAALDVLRSWAGTLDLTPDHLPVIGTPAALAGYVLAAGFSGHGFCLGPIVGRTVAELIVDAKTSLDVDDLHPDRFTRADLA